MISKYQHVRQAKQTRSHTCHWPGCTVQVPPAKWGCLSHWRRLPKSIRDNIWAAYVPGQEFLGNPTQQYLKAANDAQEWIKRYGT